MVLVIAGCGGDDKKDAEQTVHDFVEATRERDADTFCDDLVTQEFLEQSFGTTGDKARDSCKRELKALTDLRVELIRIEKTVVDGDSATVTAAINSQGQRIKQKLRLKKEDGDWKLAGSGE